MKRDILTVLALSALLLAGAGCASRRTEPKPNYSRRLPPGAAALRKIEDPARWPDVRSAYRDRGEDLANALTRSVAWFDAPSTEQWFPIEGITHERARMSVRAALDLLERGLGDDAFETEFKRLFDAYESVGWNDEGIVFYTGYYAPVFAASRTRTEHFRCPLYRRPADLVTDLRSGTPLGRRLPDGRVASYPARAEIEDTGMLAGSELVWLEDRLAAFIVHVNGSAKLTLPDGSIMYVGYAGKTDRPYESLGQLLVQKKLLSEDAVSLETIRRVYRARPLDVEELMRKNESYVFFREAQASEWPAGSLGFPVTAERSLATDKRIFPRGGLVLVDTRSIRRGEARRRYHRFMLDQDTGGAIRAPGRADIFMGTGPEAEALAGVQKAEGRLYYFFLKPEHVPGKPPRL